MQQAMTNIPQTSPVVRVGMGKDVTRSYKECEKEVKIRTGLMFPPGACSANILERNTFGG